MPRFEYEIIRRFEVVTTVTVNAKDADDAQAKIDKKVEDGTIDKGKISVTVPDGWHLETDEYDVTER